jgi:uncharacterized protein YndB with AHSA1/START domain
MKKTLTFTVSIAAPRQLVWETMLGPEGYTAWTSAFADGCYFAGSWDEGSKIQFLAPGGDGMTAVIAQNRPYEFISIRHLGEIRDGVEDTTSEKVKAWAPAYENYEFADTEGGSTVTVSLDTVPEYEQSMLDTYPKALGLLKELCERVAPLQPGPNR